MRRRIARQQESTAPQAFIPRESTRSSTFRAERRLRPGTTGLNERASFASVRGQDAAGETDIARKILYLPSRRANRGYAQNVGFLNRALPGATNAARTGACDVEIPPGETDIARRILYRPSRRGHRRFAQNVGFRQWSSTGIDERRPDASLSGCNTAHGNRRRAQAILRTRPTHSPTFRAECWLHSEERTDPQTSERRTPPRLNHLNTSPKRFPPQFHSRR